MFGHRECFIRVVYIGMRKEGIARFQSVESVDRLCRDLGFNAFSTTMVPSLHSMVSMFVSIAYLNGLFVFQHAKTFISRRTKLLIDSVYHAF